MDLELTPETDSSTLQAHAAMIVAPVRTGLGGIDRHKPNGRITLEVAVRFPESGRIWELNKDDRSDPMQTLLPLVLEGGAELVARYPGDLQWQLLTLHASR